MFHKKFWDYHVPGLSWYLDGLVFSLTGQYPAIVLSQMIPRGRPISLRRGGYRRPLSLQLDGPHDFTALKKRLGAADGSLGLQLRKLEEAAYVRSERSFVGRRPRTTYRLTGKGRSALAGYLDTLQRLLVAMGRTSGAG